MDVLILGSTGSIGKNAIEVCIAEGHNVVGLTCNKNVDLLLEQYNRLKPKFLAIESLDGFEKLKTQLNKEDVTILGPGGAYKLASDLDYHVVLNSIVGMAGLKPAYFAAKSGKRLALANKESIVVFGETLIKIANENSTEIIPVDSEHSAIFQCLQGEKNNEISKILLTASGGPFRNMTIEERAVSGPDKALKHPNWSMGQKISVDSATMMNKGLEYIEAMRLFGVDSSQVEVLIHPESIVHSAVQFKDNSIIAQMSVPDMKLPIQYAINYPKRSYDSSFAIKELDFSKGLSLNFHHPDYEGFPCLSLAIDAAERGGFYPCALNAANEFAVSKYLKGNIGFYEISDIVRNALNLKYTGNPEDLDDIIDCHKRLLW